MSSHRRYGPSAVTNLRPIQEQGNTLTARLNHAQLQPSEVALAIQCQILTRGGGKKATKERQHPQNMYSTHKGEHNSTVRIPFTPRRFETTSGREHHRNLPLLSKWWRILPSSQGAHKDWRRKGWRRSPASPGFLWETMGRVL